MSKETVRAKSGGEGLAAQLRELVGDKREIDIAQFQFIGFDEIAKAYGERWEAQRGRVRATAQAFIKRRLGPRDVLVRAEDGFVLVFGGLDGDAARAFAEEVKRELNAFYLGEGATRPVVQLSVSHERLDVENLIEAVGDMDFDTAATGPRVDERLAGIEFKFKPVWDAQREAIFNYYMTPILSATGERVPGYQYDLDLGREYAYPVIEEAALTRSDAVLADMVAQNNRSLMGVSLHYSSLRNSSTRNALCSVIDGLNRELLRYRVVQVAAVPPGCPRIYLQEMFAALKRRVPNVAVSVAWNEEDLRSILQMKPAAIGFALSPWALGDSATLSEHDLCAKAKKAADAARTAKIPFYVEGRLGPSLARRLGEMGVSMLSSRLIWPIVDAPAGTHRWRADQLVA